MLYQVLANATMIAHFAFLVYVVVGGFLAWRRLGFIWPHLLLAGWGFSTIVFSLNCPLTYVEDWARQRAGDEGLSTGFIDHYLEGVIYPERFAAAIQIAGAIIVVTSWIGVVVIWRRRRAAARTAAAGAATGSGATDAPDTDSNREGRALTQ